MNQPTSRTPGPWIVDASEPSKVLGGAEDAFSGLPVLVANCDFTRSPASLEECDANAAYIVEAVNGYEALRAQLAAVTAENKALFEQNAKYAADSNKTFLELTAMKASQAGLVRELENLISEPLCYNGKRIEIECDSHIHAMNVVRNAREALAAAKLSSAE